jgi:hypothetical protein
MELIHICYRITDPDEALGFEERRRMPIRDEAINVHVGAPPGRQLRRAEGDLHPGGQWLQHQSDGRGLPSAPSPPPYVLR